MDALVIGAGPAGLMAAEALADAGRSVTVADAKPSVGRKFLMAGKSGLNLTMDERLNAFLRVYAPAGPMVQALTEFGPEQVVGWAEGLGQEVFTGSSGRVFPRAMKASPLLRAWLKRLTEKGVVIRAAMRCTGRKGLSFEFQNGEVLTPRVAVLAMGGASWSRLGSDGAWADWIGAPVKPFQPANMGFVVPWSDHMARHFGSPIKPVILNAGKAEVRGEFIISARGIEGSGIYAVSKPMREGAELTLDLMPDWTEAKIAEQLTRPRGKTTLTSTLRKSLKLDPAKIALLQEFARPLPKGAALAKIIKGLRVYHNGPRPLDEAISTAGGLSWDALDGFMLRDQPGLFAAGEMLDWEAPTGGYLITGCLATGRAAGQQAAAFPA